MSILRAAFESRSYPSSAPFDGAALSIPAPGSGAFGSTAGVAVSDASALSIITFFAGVRIISDAVSTTPVRAVTVQPDGTRKPVLPSPQAITDPFMAVSLAEGISQIVTSLLLRGNAYLYVVDRDKVTFKPSKLRILNPDQVSVRWDDDGYRQYGISGRWFGDDQVVHLTGFMLPNALKGAGIIEYCRNALGIGIALEDVAGQFFSNGVMSPGMISTDVPLTDDQSRQAAEMFMSRHSGVSRAYKPIVLGGGAKYIPLTLSAEDAQFIESRQFSAAQMATLLGVPPHLLGIVDKTTSWGTGIEVQGRAFVDYSLRAFFTRLQSMFTAWLVDGMFADFVTDVITRADTKTRYENHALALAGNNGIGWKTVNEVRVDEGLARVEGGDVLFRSSTYLALDEAPPTDLSPIPPNDPSTGAPDVGTED